MVIIISLNKNINKFIEKVRLTNDMIYFIDYLYSFDC